MSFELWVFGIGYWVLGFGFWVLGFGFWVLGIGFWVLGFGFWVLGLRYSAIFFSFVYIVSQSSELAGARRMVLCLRVYCLQFSVYDLGYRF